MSPIAFQTIEGRVAFVKEINFSQSLKLFLVLLRMYKKNYLFRLSSPHISFSRMTLKKLSAGLRTKLRVNGALRIVTFCPLLMMI